MVGSGVVSILYERIQWSGINFLSAALAIVALVPISLTPTPLKGDRPKPTGWWCGGVLRQKYEERRRQIGADK